MVLSEMEPFGEAMLEGEVDQLGVGVQAQSFHHLVPVELHSARRDPEN
ncbi:hypothetical protein [Hydrogenophaga sp. PAMC20947]|nr:hypothetical protein [Hydrogenophaga sp. PAMC20947]